VPLPLVEPVFGTHRADDPVDVEQHAGQLVEEVIQSDGHSLDAASLCARNTPIEAPEYRAWWARDVLHIERRGCLRPQAAAYARQMADRFGHGCILVDGEAAIEARNAAMVDGHEDAVRG
jgi:hypothetical protein